MYRAPYGAKILKMLLNINFGLSKTSTEPVEVQIYIYFKITSTLYNSHNYCI